MKTVVVLGGRSGTSAVAGMLTKLGVYMGKNMLSDRKSGSFYENVDFANLNSEMRSYAHCKPLEDKVVDSVSWPLMNNVKETVKRHAREPIWGFKEPRTMYLLNIYEKFIEDPHYILCFRDPEAMARSMEKRLDRKRLDNPNQDWLQIATDMRRTMYNETHGRKCLIVEYELLLSRPTQIVDSMVEFLGLDPTPEQHLNAVRHIDPNRKHF